MAPMEDKRNAHKVLPLEHAKRRRNENSVTCTKGHNSFWFKESIDQISNYVPLRNSNFDIVLAKADHSTLSWARWIQFTLNILHIDIFVNWNLVATRWQQYSTHLHTNSTQHNTINLGRVRAMPRLCVLYPGICLTTEEKARQNLSQG